MMKGGLVSTGLSVVLVSSVEILIQGLEKYVRDI